MLKDACKASDDEKCDEVPKKHSRRPAMLNRGEGEDRDRVAIKACICSKQKSLLYSTLSINIYKLTIRVLPNCKF